MFLVWCIAVYLPKVVSSAIVDKYIGESARMIREMFGYARDHEPCIIFMDEIDAIGGRRFSEGLFSFYSPHFELMVFHSCWLFSVWLGSSF